MAVAAKDDAGASPVKIALKGDLLSTNADAGTQTLHEALEGTRAGQRFVVDLRTARMIDSVGLNTLLGFIKRVNERGGAVTLRIGSPSVKRLFDISFLHELATIDYRPRARP